MEPLLLRENEALEMLGIGRTTLWRLMKNGEITSVRVGRARRFPAATLKVWVERQILAEEERRSDANSNEVARSKHPIAHRDGIT